MWQRGSNDENVATEFEEDREEVFAMYDKRPGGHLFPLIGFGTFIMINLSWGPSGVPAKKEKRLSEKSLANNSLIYSVTQNESTRHK